MDPISPLLPGASPPQRLTGTGPQPVETSFADHLAEATSKAGEGNAVSGALQDVQALQDRADDAIRKLASGETQDVHQVMIAFEQARLSMQLLVEVRNKMVEAYQEISRMPM
jgi:flagellar hook-basal body complex protein FliE